MHGVQPRGLQLLEAMFPGLTADLADAGAVRGRMRFHLSGYRLAPPVGGRPGLFASRPLLEHHVRSRVAGFAHCHDHLALPGHRADHGR